MNAGAGPAAGRGPLRPWIAVASMAVGAFLAAGPCAAPHANPDAHAFEAIARSVAAGTGLSYVEPMLPDLRLYAFRNPLYPALIAWPLTAGGVAWVLALQGALAGLTALGVGAIARRLGGERAGWWGWALAMAWTPTWALSGQLLSEVLYVALSVAAVERTLAARDAASARASLAAAALAGAAAGAAMLTRSPGAVLAVALAASLVRRPAAAAALALAAVLVWLPWPLRNQARLHAFVPLTTNGQMNFYAGNSETGIAACWEDIAARPELGELGFERHFAARTRAEVLSDPLRLAAGIARKAVHHVAPLRREIPGLLLFVFEGVILLACLRRPACAAALAPLALAFAAQWLLQALTVVGPRYRYPTDWLVLAAFAACAASWRTAVRPGAGR